LTKMPASRFAVALSEYLQTHEQQVIAEKAHISRAVASNIANGHRRPSQDAARALIAAAETDTDRARLLLAWLEDQTPETCRGLVEIHLAHASGLLREDATPYNAGTSSGLEARAIEWAKHQLAVNVHARRALLDLYLASGSPEVTEQEQTEADAWHRTQRPA
jgi:transcriptional regulator with XRE-family HTH domain